MKKKGLSILLAVIMIFALCACGNDAASNDGDAAADDTVYVLKANWENDTTNYMIANWDEWMNKVVEKSNGRIQYEPYYNCTLLDPNAEMQQLMSGIADLSDAKKLANDGFIIGEKWKVLTAGIPIEKYTSLSYDFCEAFPEIMEELAGVKVLAQAYNGSMPYQLLTTQKEVHSPADMEGLTFWCEPDWNEFVKACGATPVNTPWTEVYSSLQKNMYDGLMIPVDTLQSQSFAEVCDYVTFIDFMSLSGPGYFMNLDTYNKLPDDLKAIIDDKELIAELEQANADDGAELQKSSMEWAEENYGTKSITLTEDEKAQFLEKLNEGKAVLAKDLDAQGLPGTEMVAKIAEYAAAE